MDSCSCFYKRWPKKQIISNSKKSGFFRAHKTIVMQSSLQYNDYNCGSFVFAFIEILTKLYKDFEMNNKIIINYLFRYFRYFSNEGFITENTNIYKTDLIDDFGEIKLFVLPVQFLELSQSITMLKELNKSISDNINKKEIKNKIEQLIKQMETNPKIKEIDKIREKHLIYLNTCN